MVTKQNFESEFLFKNLNLSSISFAGVSMFAFRMLRSPAYIKVFFKRLKYLKLFLDFLKSELQAVTT